MNFFMIAKSVMNPMNDDQCQALIDAIKYLSNEIAGASDRIVQAIDGIYSPSMNGVEETLQKIADTIWEK